MFVACRVVNAFALIDGEPVALDAVSINGEAVPRALWPERILRPGDVLSLPARTAITTDEQEN